MTPPSSPSCAPPARSSLARPSPPSSRIFHPGRRAIRTITSRTPGGSSSGSAAAVAAGMVPLALGSQTNGSVIRPAAFCGVFAVKPTHGLVSRAGVLPLSRKLDHIGAFARSLPDLALMLDVIAGYDPADPDTRPFAGADFRAVAERRSAAPRISRSCARRSGTRPNADTKAAFEAAGRRRSAPRRESVELPGVVCRSLGRPSAPSWRPTWRTTSRAVVDARRSRAR